MSNLTRSYYSSTPYGQMRDRLRKKESKKYLTLKEQRFVPYKTIMMEGEK